MQKKELQDLYFMENRFNLLEIAAFLDRVERGEGEADYRDFAFKKAIEAMISPQEGLTRTQAVHHTFSDHSQAPVESASIQFANGAINLND